MTISKYIFPLICILLFAACIQELSLEGRPCPCAAGWKCCSDNICIPVHTECNNDFTEEQKFLLALEGNWVGSAEDVRTKSGSTDMRMVITLPQDGEPSLDGLVGTIVFGQDVEAGTCDPDDPPGDTDFDSIRDGYWFELMDIAIVNDRLLAAVKTGEQWTECCQAIDDIFECIVDGIYTIYSCDPCPGWDPEPGDEGYYLYTGPNGEEFLMSGKRQGMCMAEMICRCDQFSCDISGGGKIYDLDITVDIDNGVMAGTGLGRIEAIKNGGPRGDEGEKCNLDGTCSGSLVCSPDNICGPCFPDCGSRECGLVPNGCGDSCGECTNGLSCDISTKTCISCTPDCGARVCGPVPNGCGFSCGECVGTYDECNADGECFCLGNCETRQCGPAPDCPTFNCGTCDGNDQCNSITGMCSPDIIPPTQVENLFAQPINTTTIQLSWTAPGDDANTGTVTRYEIRQSFNVISESNFNDIGRTVFLVPGPARPVSAGQTETIWVGALSDTNTYFFALKAVDDGPAPGNYSEISNNSSAKPGPDGG